MDGKAGKWMAWGLCLGLASEAQALVDYSAPEKVRPQSSGARVVSPAPASTPIPRPRLKTVRTPRPSSRSSSRPSSAPPRGVEFGLHYESVNIDLPGLQGPQVNFVHLNGGGQIAGQFFFQGHYWQARSPSPEFAGEGRWQAGNPKAIVGFHWLQFGPPQSQVTLDFYGGLRWKARKSPLASGATSRILGVSTAKRFSSVVLGLGYEMHLTGRPRHSGEKHIGNVLRPSASLGWQFGPGARLLLEAFNYSVGKAGSAPSALALDRKLRFSVLNTQLQLALVSLHPALKMELGATFRSRRLRDRDVIAAKLWNYRGSYGNSLYAGLSLAL